MNTKINHVTLPEFLKLAGITYPAWAVWVRRGQAPAHKRVAHGKRERIFIERAEVERWFRQRAIDRMRTRKDWLRAPLPKEARDQWENPFEEVAAEGVVLQPVHRVIEELRKASLPNLSPAMVDEIGKVLIERILAGDEAEAIAKDFSAALRHLVVEAHQGERVGGAR